MIQHHFPAIPGVWQFHKGKIIESLDLGLFFCQIFIILFVWFCVICYNIRIGGHDLWDWKFPVQKMPLPFMLQKPFARAKSNEPLPWKNLELKKNCVKNSTVKILTSGPDNISQSSTRKKKNWTGRSFSSLNNPDLYLWTSSAPLMADICSCSRFTILWDLTRSAKTYLTKKLSNSRGDKIYLQKFSDCKRVRQWRAYFYKEMTAWKN